MTKKSYRTLAGATDIAGLMSELAADIRNKNLIITETIPYVARGKPRPNNLVDTDLSRLGDVWMQIGDQDGRIRVRCRSFEKWLMDRHMTPSNIVEQLRSIYHVGQSKQTIGSGVAGLDALAKFGRAECYDFTPLHTPGSGGPTQ